MKAFFTGLQQGFTMEQTVTMYSAIYSNLNSKKMSQYIDEKPKSKGFKPFAIIFGGLVIFLVVVKILMELLM
jgi:hypothetical protein